MRGGAYAQDVVEARLRAQAARTAAKLIKIRARTYANGPMALETLLLGFWAAAPGKLAAAAQLHFAAERNLPCRWFGAGGEIPLVNAKSALLLGRALCRAAHKRTGAGACLPTSPE